MAEAADFHGMTPSPARRRLRRTGALLAGAPVLAAVALFGGSPAGAAPQTLAADAIGTSTVDVAVNSLTPSAPVDGDTVTVTGTLKNDGKQTVNNAHVALRVGSVLGGRASIDAASRHAAGGLPDGREIGGKYAEKISKLAPGSTQTFSLSVPVKELNLGADGVYRLGVALTGQTAIRPYPQTLGIQRTFLPWQPEAAGTKTKTTFLWPLISQTHLTAETGSDEQQTRVFHDDSLAKEIAPGGRLQQMLALGTPLDVTWVIDPDLLASVDAMTRPYRIKQPDGTEVAGKNQAVAKQWLNDLKNAVADKKVVALPFADPDLASLAHNGTKVTGSLGHLKDATDAATTTVETVLHVKPDTSYAWPADGAIDPSIVNVATSAGADTVIARSDSLQERSGLTYTPSAARPIGSGTTAVVADARLSEAFEGDMTGAENSTLAVQKFLAQSLMINLQEPDNERSIVVAPQRMPSASQAQSMAQAIKAEQDSGWSESQDLAAATKAKPDPRAMTRVPSSRYYPSSLRKQQLPRSAFEAIQDTQNKLTSFQVILTYPSRVVTPFGRAMDRQMSTSWRGHPTEARAFRDGVADYLTSLTKRVRLIEKSEAKLSGRSATIPVTVQNNLVQGVEHLVLRLTSTNGTRLKIGNGPYDEQRLKIAGGHSQSVKFTTTSNANGRVPVFAQLYTDDGQPYGPEVRFDVNVTEITPTVMLVMAGGVLLLVLAGFRMYTQRKRAAAQRAEEGPDDGPNGESGPESGEDDPEQPSDPTPDTAPESSDPSGTGERVDR
ncbi:hypothetical protein EOT10_08835 [Streptomyces antnestii]|uniref:Uncharacterized protein n=1 Tax=Streptomyces antnestii TaxID=2494256 RepID=A0A3S2WL41_9ACTN|nr:DUF6049 family protein [Streptomyces sp. San01]RVU27269.1 hypothetical protein EOT10_08835 [Streptomyces sp. San01]